MPSSRSIFLALATTFIISVAFLSLTPALKSSYCEAGVGNHFGRIDSPDIGVFEGRQLRVYVYDLPRKFNFALIELFARNRGMLPSTFTDADLKYPGHQHSGEWYIFADLLWEDPPFSRARLFPSAAVRVKDPRAADVFFVPVFSSLSLVVHPLSALRDCQMSEWDPSKNCTLGKNYYRDFDMQYELMDWLEAQEPWKRSNGRDHVFPAQDPNALKKVWNRTRNSIMLVSDFGRMESYQGFLEKDVVLPYVHRVNTLDEAKEGPGNRTNLLFFMGNRFRKDGKNIRDTLFHVLENETTDGVVLKEGLQSSEGRRAGATGMRSSKFCLHPVGDTPSACRLFDAIVNLCVPVIVSDYIELPFEDLVDYSAFSVFIPISEAVKEGELVSQLRAISEEELERMRDAMRRVRRYFEWDRPDGTVSQMWRKVATKVPAIREHIHRDRRRVPGIPDNCTCRCSVSRDNGMWEHVPNDLALKSCPRVPRSSYSNSSAVRGVNSSSGAAMAPGAAAPSQLLEEGEQQQLSPSVVELALPTTTEAAAPAAGAATPPSAESGRVTVVDDEGEKLTEPSEGEAEGVAGDGEVGKGWGHSESSRASLASRMASGRGGISRERDSSGSRAANARAAGESRRNSDRGTDSHDASEEKYAEQTVDAAIVKRTRTIVQGLTEGEGEDGKENRNGEGADAKRTKRADVRGVTPRVKAEVQRTGDGKGREEERGGDGKGREEEERRGDGKEREEVERRGDGKGREEEERRGGGKQRPAVSSRTRGESLGAGTDSRGEAGKAGRVGIAGGQETEMRRRVLVEAQSEQSRVTMVEKRRERRVSGER